MSRIALSIADLDRIGRAAHFLADLRNDSVCVAAFPLVPHVAPWSHEQLAACKPVEPQTVTEASSEQPPAASRHRLQSAIDKTAAEPASKVPEPAASAASTDALEHVELESFVVTPPSLQGPLGKLLIEDVPAVTPATTFKMVSWNLGSAASASLKNAPDRVRGVVRAILAETPDVVALQEAVMDMKSFAALFPSYKLVRPSDNPKSDHAFLVREGVTVQKCLEVRVATWRSQFVGAGHAGRSTRDPPAALILQYGKETHVVVSIHAPPVPRPESSGIRITSQRAHDVFMNRLLGDDESIRSFMRSIGLSEKTLVVLAGDFNEQVHCEPATADQDDWVFTGDQHTWTANSGGLDFFAIEKLHDPRWTMAQHELTQTRRKDTSKSITGASNHDPIVLTMRSRVQVE